jgi:hypothetical protein
MVCFQTKNPNLGKICRVLQWKRMVYFMDSWSILVRGNLVFFPRFGILYKEKSGNPVHDPLEEK